MKKQAFIFLFLLTGLVTHAQTDPVTKRTCASGEPSKAWDNWFNARTEEFRKSDPAQKSQANFAIPVIFHVVSGGQPAGIFPNISQAQINSQIVILNKDYSGTGLNATNFSGTAFSSTVLADCNILFCLAEKDPNGVTLAEKGIERISYWDKGWASPASFTTLGSFKSFIDDVVKANTIWDPSLYLNIWVTDVNSTVNLLGYSTFPPGTGMAGIGASLGTLTDDGVWCWAKALGNTGFVAPSYDQGRTATHEIGHYLGLRHIWGDSNCGNDYCNDTPTQQSENTGCPSYPKVTCSNAPNGDMFMNFMDYSYDPCMYMFTNDQKSRMQTALTNSPLRMQLSASAATLCLDPLGVADRQPELYSRVEIFPNPAAGSFYIDTRLSSSQNLAVTVYNVLGQPVLNQRFEQVTQNRLTIHLDSQPNGVYLVEISNSREKAVKQLILAR